LVVDPEVIVVSGAEVTVVVVVVPVFVAVLVRVLVIKEGSEAKVVVPLVEAVVVEHICTTPKVPDPVTVAEV
jgi:hypothetical protein